MGKGYAILIWDDWGAGLVRINARLYAEGEDLYGNPNNWFSTKYEPTNYEIDQMHSLSAQFGDYWEVIW